MKIKLTQGKFALVSNRDYWSVKRFTWYAVKNGRVWYAVTHPHFKEDPILMHRLLAGFPPFQLDHKNGNGLDNRRRNLRPATGTQNQGNRRLSKNNTSGFKGVSWHKRSKKWVTHIGVRGRSQRVGCFSTRQAARQAYAKAARQYFGEFARI